MYPSNVYLNSIRDTVRLLVIFAALLQVLDYFQQNYSEKSNLVLALINNSL